MVSLLQPGLHNNESHRSTSWNNGSQPTTEISNASSKPMFCNKSLGKKKVSPRFSNKVTVVFGLQQYIKIPAPSPDSPDGFRVFSFYLSSDSKDKPQSSFDCIHQFVSG